MSNLQTFFDVIPADCVEEIAKHINASDMRKNASVNNSTSFVVTYVKTTGVEPIKMIKESDNIITTRDYLDKKLAKMLKIRTKPSIFTFEMRLTFIDSQRELFYYRARVSTEKYSYYMTVHTRITAKVTYKEEIETKDQHDYEHQMKRLKRE